MSIEDINNKIEDLHSNLKDTKFDIGCEFDISYQILLHRILFDDMDNKDIDNLYDIDNRDITYKHPIWYHMDIYKKHWLDVWRC